MSEEVKIEVELRKYLLGILDAAQTEEIEKNLVSDEKYFQEIQIVEAEIIQDFVDKKLNQEEKKAFEENFIITKERREQINFARALRKLVDEKPKPQIEKNPSFFDSLKSFFLSPIPAFCGVLAIVGISVFVWWNYSNKSEVLVALNRSQKNERPTDARISDFDYAPKTEGTRGNNSTENLDLVFAKSRATEAVLKNPTAENYHELGRVYLAEKNFDESVKQFEKAVKLNPNIAKLNSDLGVALMEKGKQKEEGSLELYAKANESISKAIEQDKNLKEAYFNLALAIELLNLPNQAQEAWENYLKLDSTSKWADEARERLKKLEENKPISKTKEEVLQDFFEAKKANDTEKAWQTLSRNREMITGKLIPQQLAFLFVDAKAGGNEAKAKEALDALVYAGKLEEEKSGDLFWRDLAKYYSGVYSREIPKLKEAHQALFKGYEQHLKNEFTKALGEFQLALQLFSETGNIWQGQIGNNYIANSLGYIEKKSDEVERKRIEITNQILKFSQEKRYKWLELLQMMRITSIRNEANQHSVAISNAEKSYIIARNLEDSYAEQVILGMLTSLHSRLGNKKKAIEFTQMIFAKMNSADNSLRQKWRNYFNAAELFFSVRNFSAAKLAVKEELLVAQQISETGVLSTSQTHSGVIYAKTKDFSEARDLLNKGMENAQKLPDEKFRKNLVAYSLLKLAHLEKELGNFDESARLYNQSFEVNNSPYFEFEIQKGRLKSFLAEGNDEALEQQIPKTIQILEYNRTKILEEEQSNVFFHNENDVFETAVEWEFKRGHFQESYNYAEGASARSLLDLLEKNRGSIETIKNAESMIGAIPLRLDEIQPQMPANVQILQYTVLDKKLLIWLISNEKFVTKELPVSSEELQTKVEKFVSLILENKTEISEETLLLSKELFSLLIQPIYAELDKNKQLCLIPGKSLFFIPFSTLMSSEEKTLLEEFVILYAPSANIFIHCTKNAEKKANRTSETLLGIGNPAFDKAVSPELPNLEFAEKETENIAWLYDESIVLLKKAATKTAFQQNISQADVLHFAGHYVVKQDMPLSSSLLLAKNDENPEQSFLTNAELSQEKLNRLKLVILSSCETGVESYFSGEGMVGLSRTFLGIDTPLVVASQWKVDSEATAALMQRFHQIRRRESLSTAAALRKAQLEMMNGEKFKMPYYWSAFATFGGYAKF